MLSIPVQTVKGSDGSPMRPEIGHFLSGGHVILQICRRPPMVSKCWHLPLCQTWSSIWRSRTNNISLRLPYGVGQSAWLLRPCSRGPDCQHLVRISCLSLVKKIWQVFHQTNYAASAFSLETWQHLRGLKRFIAKYCYKNNLTQDSLLFVLSLYFFFKFLFTLCVLTVHKDTDCPFPPSDPVCGWTSEEQSALKCQVEAEKAKEGGEEC